jgi:hypothetical protein
MRCPGTGLADECFRALDASERTVAMATLRALLSEGPAVPVRSRAGRLPVGPARHDRCDVRRALGRLVLVRGLRASESSPLCAGRLGSRAY